MAGYGPISERCTLHHPCLRANTRHCRYLFNDATEKERHLYVHRVSTRIDTTFCALMDWADTAEIPMRIEWYAPFTVSFKTAAHAVAFKLKWV